MTWTNDEFIRNLIKMGKGGAAIIRFEITHGFNSDTEEGKSLLSALTAIDKVFIQLPIAIKDLEKELK